MIHNLRLAWRGAARQPGFTLLVVMTLAIGIGANSAIFALVDGVLLKPLPYHDPARLVFVWQTLPEHNVAELEPTPFDYTAWQGVSSFSSVAMTIADAFTIADGDAPERVRGARVTSSLMPLLGIAPRVGRPFLAAEDDEAAAPVAILSDGLWRRRYGADPAILGRDIRVNGVNHTVVGVMPPAMSLPGPLAGSDELWLPARMSAAERTNEVSHNFVVVARLASGATLAAAGAELDAFARRMAAERRSHHAIGARIVPFTEQTVRAIRPALLVAAGGVALLLLVACANAATLLIARAAGRRHETAVRAALGASRSHIVSLSAADSLVLTALGGAVGLVFGGWALRAFVPLFAGALPSTQSIHVDARAAAFTAALAVLLGAGLGVIVAALEPRGIVDALKSSARTATAGGAVTRARSALVVMQIALAVVLLSAAGLMLKSVARLSKVDTGFDPSRVLTFKLSVAGSGYADASRQTAFADRLLGRLTSVPGVSNAALTSVIPFGGMRAGDSVEVEGRPKKSGELIIIDQRVVTPGYFPTMRIPVVAGRPLSSTDTSAAEPVVVVNRAMAERFWAGASAIDRRVRIVGETGWLRIVGVVENVRHISLARDPVTEMYRPYSQVPVGAFTVVVKTEGNAAAAVPAAREALRETDGTLPMYDVRTMDDRIAGSFAQTRATMLLLLVTAALAAALAGVAIYGSIWYAVSLRIPEIGLRMALGATRGSVCRNVVGRAIGLTSAGSAIGIAAAAATAPVLRSLLFETPAIDATTYVAVAGALFALTIAASAAPARRAMSTDPIVALRSE